MAAIDTINGPLIEAGCGFGTAPTPPVRQRIPLNSLEHVGREIGRVYRAARTGAITTGDASRLTFILGTLARVLESAQLEGRISRLEEMARDASRTT